MAFWRVRRQALVEIRIIFEGGAQTNDSDIVTANNTESLRQSLNSFFVRLLGRNDVSITVGYGYRNAVKRFIEDSSYNSLFIDSDMPKEKINTWFEKLKKENFNKTIIIPKERQQYVFFMIQEMEAWFLKQPECFEEWARIEGYEKRDSEMISNHSLIREKNIEDINKPSKIVTILLRHFFEKKISNQKRKLASYGKLKTAPILLDCIDVNRLISLDTELFRFKEVFGNNNTKEQHICNLSQ